MRKQDRLRLGDLEAEIMGYVWRSRRTTVREVWEQIYEKRKIAYTTVMTGMNSLTQKGILSREKIGVTYYYTPVVTKTQVIQAYIDDPGHYFQPTLSGHVQNQ
ncbi:BlaI/MecI/CopY family transcriptional regulator, partial [Candidatus Hakubella thermalkaliphila]